MNLSSTQSITAVLSGAATPAPTYNISYTRVPSGSAGSSGGTLSATAATLLAGSSGQKARVDHINIHNADNASITLTVNFVDGSTTTKLWVGTLAEGDTLQWTPSKGWEAIDNTGRAKTTPFTVGAALTAALTTITPADAEGTPDYAIAAVTDTSPFGFASAQEAITLLYVVKNLQTKMAEVEARLEAAGLVAAN